MQNWTYNEFKHCGVDYSDAGQVAKYEDRHRRFRNFDNEFTGMLDFTGLNDTSGMTVIDLGCGTGVFPVLASKRFKKVYAVDVSEVMLGHARGKAKEAGVSNVEFVNAGFLTYEHKSGQADLVMTKAALHHLPDFWKQVALLNMNRMLKTDGILYLHDVVFHFEPAEYAGKINGYLAHFEKLAGAGFTKEVETHIKDEYSTFGWVLEGMISKAGFSIEKSRTSDGFMTEYSCRKVKEL